MHFGPIKVFILLGTSRSYFQEDEPSIVTILILGTRVLKITQQNTYDLSSRINESSLVVILES